MPNSRSPVAAALLAFVILALGFVSGLGYQSWQHAQRSTQNNDPSNDDPSTPPARRAPMVRNLRVAPDDRLLAFTATYNRLSQAGRFVFDLNTYLWDEAPTPRGWQDSLAQWSKDGRALLWTRERIPRAVEDATSGLHRESVALDNKQFKRGVPEPLFEKEPVGEDTVSGFWSPDGKLIVKTRRESKSLFADDGKLLDRSSGTYYQNRAVVENGKTVLYVVRDISLADGTVGLFRVENGGERALGSVFSDVVWAYVSEDAKRLILCRYAANGRDWEWSLYRVTPSTLTFEKKAVVPGDVIAVFWSPDGKYVLGAAGKSLWLTEIPSLKTTKLGTRDDWNADDAVWLNRQQAILVAASGVIWKVSTPDGARHEVWRFPNEYWK